MNEIIYHYRGPVERLVRCRGKIGRYVWRDGFSPDGTTGGVIYPWMTRRECQREAATQNCVARFAIDGVVPPKTPRRKRVPKVKWEPWRA